VFRRPELLVAASVPVLLVAGVLPWHRDVLCTQAGCGTVSASAWTGSPVWALVLLLALALAGAWVLVLPTRGRVPLAVAALTGMAGVVSAAIVVVSLDALVFNRAGFFGFDLPVTETFPVLAVHAGAGLPLGLVGLLLQAVGGWTTVRHRAGLVTPSLRRPTRPDPGRAAFPPGAADPGRAAFPPGAADPGRAALSPGVADPGRAAFPPGAPGPAGAGFPPAGPAREAVAFGQGAPPPRRHRRR
jgi:hypothetical protein